MHYTKQFSIAQPRRYQLQEGIGKTIESQVINQYTMTNIVKRLQEISVNNIKYRKILETTAREIARNTGLAKSTVQFNLKKNQQWYSFKFRIHQRIKTW